MTTHRSIDPASLDKAAIYALMTEVIAPRPIAWIGTTDGTAADRDDPTGDNLAPFSFFMGVSSDPPLLAVSIARGRGGALKHTARNILATGCFSVSIPSVGELDPMHATGASWPASEFEAVGVPRAAGVAIVAPRPAEAAFTMECVLHQAIDLDATHLVIGRVVGFLAQERVMDGARVVPGALHPIARLGGDAYGEIGSVHHRARVPAGSRG